MKTRKKEADGFTLIELLTVIAIIGILAAIIIPTVGSVKTSANKAKSKVQFSQWAGAISLFKQEYGYYPYFSNSSPGYAADSGVYLDDSTARQMFYDVLAGKKPDGTAITGAALTQNKRRNAFYSFADSELIASGASVSSINDAFGNLQIYVKIDYDNDGIITGALPAVKAGATAAEISASAGYQPTLPTGGIRAGVVFYSPGKGTSANDIVTSW